jgi:hypothetical protein
MKTTKRDLRHELISDLHRLLSIASADDFLAASRLCKSGNIKLALEALAEEHLGEARTQKRNSNQSNVRRRPSRLRGHPQLPIGGLEEVLQASPHFATKSDLLRFISSEGIDIPNNPKESRSRIIGRIIRHVDSLSPDRRAEIYRRASRANDQQTEGWLKVIRGR